MTGWYLLEASQGACQAGVIILAVHIRMLRPERRRDQRRSTTEVPGTGMGTCQNPPPHLEVTVLDPLWEVPGFQRFLCRERD